MLTTHLAEYLCHIQPLQVRARLFRDESFRERLGLSKRSFITLWGMTIDTQELFTAARRAFLSKEDQILTALEGGVMKVTADDTCLLVNPLNGNEQVLEYRFNELLILSTCGEMRKHALDNLLQSLGPTSSDFSLIREKIGTCELNDDEVSRLLDEIGGGVTALQKRAAWAIEGGRFTLDDLVPSSMDYFERFCGPDPGHIEPEIYLSSLLPTYRKDLIRRDLIQGLDISLIGSLRDDLSPGLWTEQLSDDEIWNALDVCKPDRQPFSLLGALDIALGRQHDGRYYAFAADAVQKLLKDEFPRPDGINTYELIPMLSELVLNRINSLEGGALRAPHWKRMCAWMQAGLLSRLTWTFSLDLDRFREWALGSQVPAGMYANLLDLRREPMYAAANISCEAFRHEVVGRLLALQSRHKAAGRPIPRLQEIHETMTRLAESGSTVFWSLPGPLEGHRRMVEMQGRELRNDEVRLFMEQLGEQRDGRIWPQLAHISQLFNLSETLLHQIREAIGRVRLEDKWQESKTQLEWLTLASFISAAQRDIELAKEISGIIVAGSHLAVSENEVWMLLRTLLLAGSAFEDEDTWAEWIEEQLAEMAWRLSSGNASKAFLLYLRELKKVVKLSFCIHARAEAICSSAI